ncbi:hypothetical protein V1514DRAFT_332188 [Lipomyces japonicus]|uniref:uncharacterized protein n=1 Tax=Lipomyces japonicus TaxID=56871 RepID=UPI0034CF2354
MLFRHSRSSKPRHVHDVDDDMNDSAAAWASADPIPMSTALLFIAPATAELKRRAVLEPLVLLPARPSFDLQEAKSLLHAFLACPQAGGPAAISLASVHAIMSALKWIWARIPAGIVSWDVYDLFKAGEQDAGLDPSAFDTLIPILCDPDRAQVISLFFDLLSTIAAHWKSTGMSGRKLAKIAAWWAFPVDSSNTADSNASFSNAYKAWTRASDASCHLFFAYLRAKQCSAHPQSTISPLPLALSSLLQSSSYPPKRQHSSTQQSLILSSSVTFDSSSPYHILSYFHGLASHVAVTPILSNQKSLSDFISSKNSLDSDLQSFISKECYNTITELSGIHPNQTQHKDFWSFFRDAGFDSLSSFSSPPPPPPPLPPQQHVPVVFASSDDATALPAPPLAVSHLALEDSFWWAWIIAHGPEETAERKSVFASSVVIEVSNISTGNRLVVLELRRFSGLHLARKRSSQSSHSRTLRRLASRSFGVRSRPNLAVAAAVTAASSSGTIKLRDRPSLLSLYREYQAGLASCHDNGNGATIATIMASPPESPAHKIHAVATAASDMRLRAQHEQQRELIGLATSKELEVEPNRFSAVIEVEDEVSLALEWAAAEAAAEPLNVNSSSSSDESSDFDNYLSSFKTPPSSPEHTPHVKNVPVMPVEEMQTRPTQQIVQTARPKSIRRVFSRLIRRKLQPSIERLPEHVPVLKSKIRRELETKHAHPVEPITPPRQITSGVANSTNSNGSQIFEETGIAITLSNHAESEPEIEQDHEPRSVRKPERKPGLGYQNQQRESGYRIQSNKSQRPDLRRQNSMIQPIFAQPRPNPAGKRPSQPPYNISDHRPNHGLKPEPGSSVRGRWAVIAAESRRRSVLANHANQT